MLTLISSLHWSFKKGDVAFGRKTGDTTHAILRWLWFPGDEGKKIRVFL